jgi:hypothetical protein
MARNELRLRVTRVRSFTQMDHWSDGGVYTVFGERVTLAGESCIATTGIEYRVHTTSDRIGMYAETVGAVLTFTFDTENASDILRDGDKRYINVSGNRRRPLRLVSHEAPDHQGGC